LPVPVSGPQGFATTSPESRIEGLSRITDAACALPVGTRMTRGFADTRLGQIHYVVAGSGPPVVLLHQTPRSWDEYRDVVPLLSKNFRTFAMDTIGFGDSARLTGPPSVEAFADGVVAFMEAMDLDQAAIVGHHTGGVIAVELTARHPELVQKLVLSGTTCVDEEGRRRAAEWPSIDKVSFSPDGSHLAELWRKRQPYYPADRPDLLHRLIIDALRVFDQVEDGHIAVDTFHMEDLLPRITCPTLLMCGTEDWAAFPDLYRLAAYLPHAKVVEVPGTGVPMVDHVPETFAAIVGEFLSSAP
jgi:pimeloyl-ACP methyl ester carboxylesterase